MIAKAAIFNTAAKQRLKRLRLTQSASIENDHALDPGTLHFFQEYSNPISPKSQSPALLREHPALYVEEMVAPESPHVCCIIVNWNGWADTLQCLESFKLNLYSNLSLLLVDNGSTNDSVHHIRSAFPNLEIVESKVNLGFGSGNNIGIRQALRSEAKYVWLLNNDTTIKSDTLIELVKTAEADNSIGAVGSVLHYVDAPDKIQAWGGGHVNLWMGTSHHFHGPVPFNRIDFITAASILLPTKVLREVGLFDERYFMYWEDTDLSFRIRRAGWKLSVAEQSRLFHKEGASSGPRSPMFDYYVTANGLRFLRQFAPMPIVSSFMIVVPRVLRRLFFGQWRRGWAILLASINSC